MTTDLLILFVAIKSASVDVSFVIRVEDLRRVKLMI